MDGELVAKVVAEPGRLRRNPTFFESFWTSFWIILDHFRGILSSKAIENRSMVVRMETTDRELQVFSAKAFQRDFRAPGEDIEELLSFISRRKSMAKPLEDDAPELQTLRERGRRPNSRL